MSYPFGEVEIAESGDRSVEAFKYDFTHILTGQYYDGMHGLKENESPWDGTYWNSSTSDEFAELLEKEPENFRYRITHYGSMKEIFKIENEILTKKDAAADPLSWNKWNGFVYETPELPRLDLIDELATKAYDKNSGLERTIVKVEDLYNDVVRLQVRFTTELSHKKISEYRNEMNANNSTKGFTITIVRRDGKKVLVGGNHTLESAHLSRCKYIEVVWIDEDLTMEEMHTLGTALNRKTEVARMTTAYEDCANDLVTLYYAKKITDDTFKDAYSTRYIKVTGGFKGNDITKVRRIARETIEEKSSWKKGKKWINWKLAKRVEEKEKKASALTDDKTFCTTAATAAFRTDRIIGDWLEDADVRIEEGMESRPNILIFTHHPTQKKMQEYVKSQVSEKHERIIKYFLIGYGVKSPTITFKDLTFWEDKIS
jgi:hypothetical protein